MIDRTIRLIRYLLRRVMEAVLEIPEKEVSGLTGVQHHESAAPEADAVEVRSLQSGSSL